MTEGNTAPESDDRSRTMRYAMGPSGGRSRPGANLRTPPGGLPTPPGSRDETAWDDPETAPGTPRPQDEFGPETSDESARAPQAMAIGPEGSIVPGQVLFQRYRVIKKLGRGGMGSVWLVEDLTLDQLLALKVVEPSLGSHADGRARFVREARLMAALRHDNAVQIYDVGGDQGGSPYILMEYIEGRNLEAILRETGPLSLETIKPILTQLCDVLHAAHTHKHKIIHRDLKPSNLMLVGGQVDGRLKLLDLGIGKKLSGDEAVLEGSTIDGAFLGTPPYTAPEQAQGHPEPRSDIYSVGVILYEMLCGKRPFDTKSFPEMMVDTLTAPPPPMAERNPAADVPVPVEAVVMRCLAKKPEDRYATALDLARAFRRAVDDLSTKERLTIAPPPPKPVPIGKKLLIAIGAVLGIVVFGLAIKAIADYVSRPEHVPGPGPVLPSVTGPEPPTALPATFEQKDGRRFQLWQGKFYLPQGYSPDKEAGTDEQGWPKVLIRDDDSQVRFIRIPGGTYRMGAVGPDDANIANKPAHKVTLRGFYIQETEVTNREVLAWSSDPKTKVGEWLDGWRKAYDELNEALTATPGDAAEHPARAIPWLVADLFAKEHMGYLPTEAQWEYAARSRGQDRATVWDEPAAGQRQVKDLARLEVLDPPYTSLSRQFPTDRTVQKVWGMAGNVSELCRDVYRDYSEDPQDNPCPKPAEDNQEIVFRGGSFDPYEAAADGQYVTTRRRQRPGDVTRHVGFRLVLECPEMGPSGPIVMK